MKIEKFNDELLTTITNDTFTSGKVGLHYNAKSLTFDNFVLSDFTPAPEPSTMLFGVISLAALGLRKKLK